MSKLADAIRRSQRVESQPMGFGAARQAARPSMLVGFSGASSAAGAAKEAGAEVIIAQGALTAAQAKTLREAAGDIALGSSAAMASGAQTKELREAGVDFLLFEPDSTPAAALLDEDIGYVLALPAAPEELFLRSLEPLTLDAVLLAALPSPLTVSGQLEISRIAMLARKPLICQVAGDVSKEDLECLRAAGIVALLAGSAADVSSLKEAVAALPPRRVRREERAVVSLPRGSQPQADDDDDDDEP